ncbi:MAG: inorganic phosphate transporter, partial [Candidatus Dormibacteraeota bacterium]|nr:inorganic phosphate transporter [Candidatus Dormibacteraeota bacterium]
STQGFAAAWCSSAVILISSHFGFPLSTTHVCSGGVIGAGAGRKVAGVRWRLAGTMVLGWLVTLPAAAGLAGAAAFVMLAIGGIAGALIVALMLLAIAVGIFLASQRTRVTAGTVNDEVPAGQVLAALQRAQPVAAVQEDVA